MVIGAAVVLLMALGVFSIIASATGAIRAFFDDTEEREYYAEFITPLVLLDPLPFESLETAPPNTLRQAAIWLALSREDQSLFERDEFGSLYLPTALVDNWALTLFGPDFQLVHETFVDSGLQFVLDETRQSYVIPITSQPINYIPEVISIENDGDLKRLTVGYKQPAGVSIETINSDMAPIKYLDYILKRNGDGYFIHAISESEMKVETMTEVTSAPAAATPAPNSISENILEQALIEQQTDNAQSSSSSSSSSSSTSVSSSSIESSEIASSEEVSSTSDISQEDSSQEEEN